MSDATVSQQTHHCLGFTFFRVAPVHAVWPGCAAYCGSTWQSSDWLLYTAMGGLGACSILCGSCGSPALPCGSFSKPTPKASFDGARDLPSSQPAPVLAGDFLAARCIQDFQAFCPHGRMKPAIRDCRSHSVQQYTTVHNSVQQCTTVYNNVQQCTTVCTVKCKLFTVHCTLPF